MDKAALKKHAERFGTDAVMETAAEEYHAGGFTFDDVVELLELCDVIHRRKQPYAKKTRVSTETRAKRLLGIEEETEAECAAN